MANKKITELPYINKLSGSTTPDNPTLNTVVPVVLYGTTNQITIENFSNFVTQYSAHTGSAGNIFTGPQTFNNNVTVNGRLTVHELVANYETSSILFSTGSTKLGDQITDKHEFTGSTNITGSLTINGADYTYLSSSNSATFTNFSSSNAAYVTNLSSSNSATFTDFSSSNATYITNLSSSNSATFTNFSSSNEAYVTNLSSSNSATFTNFSSSNATYVTNLSSSNSATFTDFSSSNATYITNLSSSNSATFTNYSSSTSNIITEYSSSINTTIYTISSSINNTINANLGATNDVVYRIQQATASLQQATASIQAYTASLKQAIAVHGTNADVIGNLVVSGSTKLGNENTDKVEVTGSVNITGYVSASGINIYSTGIPEILSTNNLRLTADSSVVITTDINGTPKIWDIDNGGTINLPGGSTISTPNVVDVIVAAGSLGVAQLANYNKGNYYAISDTNATINIDAGAVNKVWQFTDAGTINLPGSIVKPDGGEYSASLTLTSSFHAFTASILAQNVGVASVTASINAFTSSQLNVNLGNSIVTSSLNTFTASARIELNSIEAYTASLKNAISVSGTNVQIIGDLNVNKLNVQYVSSSVLVTSGSNTFGDQSTDKHEFTGSVYLQNSLLLGNEVLGNAGLNAITASTRIELNSIEAYTASLKTAAIVSSSTQISNYYKFAETSSANTFYGTQTIQGNLQLSSTSPLVYNAGNTNAMLFGFFDGSSIYGPYYQIFGSNYSNGSQRGSAEFVFDSRNSGYSGFNVAEFNGSTWLRKFRVSQYGAEVTGSFIVDGGITGSILATNSVVSGSQQILDYHLFALTASANTFYGTQSVTGSVRISGSIDDIKYIDFDTVAPATGIARLGWDDGEGTLTIGLSGGNVNIPIGVTSFETAYNADSSSISKGDVVRVSGAQGNRVAVKKANNHGDGGSATTLAIAGETIGVGAEGKVITKGPLKGIDTTAFAEGDMLYLSPVPGGITNVKQQAPFHDVRIGVAQRIHASVGIVNVQIQNGYELDEIHDVRITTASLAYNQLLARSGSVWRNETINNLGIAITGSNTFVGSQTVSGSLLVSGSSHTVQNGYIILQQVSQSLNFVDDTAAAAGGVPLGGLYRNGNFIVIRIS